MIDPPPSTRLPRRRGSTYVLVLAVAMIVVVIGLGGLAAQRVQTRRDRLEQESNRSALLAESAVEHALHAINTNGSWRTDYAACESAYGPEIVFDHGTISWRLDDLADDDLADDPAHPIRIYGRGGVGEARRAYSVVAFPTGGPLDALRTAIHADGNVDVRGTVDARLGPVSSNALVDVTSGRIFGVVEAAAIVGSANVNGSITVPAPAKKMPGAAVLDIYDAIATNIEYDDTSGSVQDLLLSPASNPYDPADVSPDGVYSIVVPSGSTLRLRRCRIEGTIVVYLKGSNARLEIDPDIVWRPARSDYPALIVYTQYSVGTSVAIDCSGELDEFASGVNFNPPHTPYYGSSDSDTSDVYPASLRGVFHVIRDEPLRTSITTITAENRIEGCLIVDGQVRMDDAKLAADPALLSSPPLGYTTVADPDNLLTNGDMEGGLTAWSAAGFALLLPGGAPHTGARRIDVVTRATASSGIKQDVTARIQSGTTYTVTAWIEMRDAPENARIALTTYSDGEGAQSFKVTGPAQTTWTQVTGQVTPTWTGALHSAKWVVTTTTSRQDFGIDDVVLVPVSAGPQPSQMVAVPGTWRAESAADP